MVSIKKIMFGINIYIIYVTVISKTLEHIKF